MGNPIAIALLAALAASSAAEAQTVRGPDAHIVRPPGGDVIDVRGEAQPVCPKRAGSGYAPPYRGWRYKPVAVGERLSRVFYGTRYVIARPARYRLPAARPNQRWIRYGDDALLVDARTGRVLKVLAGRCW